MSESKKLQLFSAGKTQYGVLADDIMTIAEWRQPAVLPHAPPAVLGVVSIHGRMLTVLDLAKLTGLNQQKAEPTHLLALRGDEQLALAISKPGDVIDLVDENDFQPQQLVTKVIKHNRVEVQILNPKELFPRVIQGRERRRRRF